MMIKTKSFFIKTLAVQALVLSGSLAHAQVNPYLHGLSDGSKAQTTSVSQYGISNYAEREAKFNVKLDGNSYLAKAGGESERIPTYGLGLKFEFPVGNNGTWDIAADYSQGDKKINVLNQDLKVKLKTIDLSSTYKHKIPQFYDIALGAGLEYSHQKSTFKVSGENQELDVKNKQLWAHLVTEREFELSQSWKMTPALKYKHLITGKISSNLGSSESYKKGYGGEFSIAFTKKYSTVEVSLVPYIDYTQYDYARKIKTVKAGLAVNFAF